jgi:uncharacterized protein YndB with AHSA1/START domain
MASKQSVAAAAVPSSSPASKEFVIERTFNAPRERVWKAWTDAEQLKQWWGPKGFLPRYAKVDLRPGGTFHYCLRSGGGQEMWGKFTYREIVAPERLVFVSSFSDEAGGTTRHPMHQSWPLEMLSTITFEDEPGGKTKITVRWQALNATAEEQKTFDDGHDSMRMGWTGTFEQFAAYLAKG